MIDVEVDLVRALLRDQHPDLADLPIELVGRGWDNAMFRLGADLAVRMPIRGLCAHLVANEQRWLPELAPKLPLPTPVPVRTGVPALGYEWPWSVVPWLPGRPWLDAAPDDLLDAAERLAAVVIALRAPAPDDAPPNPYRGVPLAERSPTTLEHLRALSARGDDLEDLDGIADGATLERCWQEHVALPPWTGEARWVHGDLHPLNLLVHEGRLSAVIDFGDLTGGDPANDLMPAWLLFDGPSRDRFLARTDRGDPDLRRRGRGWALAWGAACAANGTPANRLGELGRRTVARVVADWRGDR